MKILAVDLGLKRTGLAVSDALNMLASPAGTLNISDFSRLADEIVQFSADKQISKILLGLPRNMDGTEGESALRARAFAESLREKTGLSVVLWDERLTTKSAAHALNQTNVRGQKRKNVIDAVAAVIMLQEYLDAQRSGGDAD